MTPLIIGFVIGALVFSILSLVLTIMLYIKFEAREKSTHSIQYVPADHRGNYDENGFEILTEELKKKFDEVN